MPGSEPFFFPGAPIGCLLLHGFTAMPEEMRWLGEDLAGRGHAALGLRLAGHATCPADLARTRWTDWLVSVEEGLALLRGVTDQVFLIGHSMGGMIALVAAARYPVEGVIAMSTPSDLGGKAPPLAVRLFSRLRPVVRKPAAPAAPRLPSGGKRSTRPTRSFRPVCSGRSTCSGRAPWALPQVSVPALLMHSRADAAVAADSMPRIYQRLGTADKQMLWFDGMDHSLVRDPQRQAVFDAVASFIVHHAHA